MDGRSCGTGGVGHGTEVIITELNNRKGNHGLEN